MKYILISVVSFFVLVIAGGKYYPLNNKQFQNIAHYAVSVRKTSQCESKEPIWQRAKAEISFLLIESNSKGYSQYLSEKRSYPGLLHFTLSKVKCTSEQIRFNEETRRAYKAINLALSKGEDINGYNALGYTPLHFAIFSNNHLLVSHLIENGANVDLKTLDGESVDQIITILSDDLGFNTELIVEAISNANRDDATPFKEN